MKKISYRSKPYIRIVEEPCGPDSALPTPLPGEEGFSASDMEGTGQRGGVGRGFSMPGESVSSPTYKEEELQDYYPEAKRRQGKRVKFDDLSELLIMLADNLDKSSKNSDRELARFADFFIKKIANQKNEDYSRLFMDAIVRIYNSDIINSNAIIVDAVNIFSRIVVIGHGRTGDIESAKIEAYQAAMRRINETIE